MEATAAAEEAVVGPPRQMAEPMVQQQGRDSERQLKVDCAQITAVPKERLDLRIELVGGLSHQGTDEDESTAKSRSKATTKKRRRGSGVTPAVSIRSAAAALFGLDPALKIEQADKKKIQLNLEGVTEATYKVDFDPKAIGLTSCMATVEVECAIGGRKVTGATASIMLCNYEILFTDVETSQNDAEGVEYHVKAILFTYVENAAVAQKPVTVAVIDDAGASVPVGRSTWRLAGTQPDGSSSTTVFSNEHGEIAFTVLVAHQSPYVALVGDCIRFHLVCDWVQARDLFATVPATSRRFCPKNDFSGCPEVPEPREAVRPAQRPVPPPVNVQQTQLPPPSTVPYSSVVPPLPAPHGISMSTGMPQRPFPMSPLGGDACLSTAVARVEQTPFSMQLQQQQQPPPPRLSASTNDDGILQRPLATCPSLLEPAPTGTHLTYPPVSMLGDGRGQLPRPLPASSGPLPHWMPSRPFPSTQLPLPQPLPSSSMVAGFSQAEFTPTITADNSEEEPEQPSALPPQPSLLPPPPSSLPPPDFDRAHCTSTFFETVSASQPPPCVPGRTERAPPRCTPSTLPLGIQQPSPSMPMGLTQLTGSMDLDATQPPLPSPSMPTVSKTQLNSSGQPHSQPPSLSPTPDGDLSSDAWWQSHVPRLASGEAALLDSNAELHPDSVAECDDKTLELLGLFPLDDDGVLCCP